MGCGVAGACGDCWGACGEAGGGWAVGGWGVPGASGRGAGDCGAGPLARGELNRSGGGARCSCSVWGWL